MDLVWRDEGDDADVGADNMPPAIYSSTCYSVQRARITKASVSIEDTRSTSSANDEN